MLAQDLRVSFNEDERAQLYAAWGVPIHGKERKLCLVARLWHPSTLREPGMCISACAYHTDQCISPSVYVVSSYMLHHLWNVYRVASQTFSLAVYDYGV